MIFRLLFAVLLPSIALGQPKIVSVVNAASYQPGLPAGGALATVFVSGLAGVTKLLPGTYLAPPSQPLPDVIGDVRVIVNEDYAPLLAVIIPEDPTANVQINFQVPLSANASQMYSRSGANLVPYIGYISVAGAIQNVCCPPQFGAFFAQSNGVGVAFHASDSSMVTLENPAHPGETIVAYANDFFMTWPPPPVGLPAPSGVSFQKDYPDLKHIGNLFLQEYPKSTCDPQAFWIPCSGSVARTPTVKITSMTLAPGLVGVEEIRFVVPQNQQPGNWALFFNDGSCPDGSGLNCGAQRGVSSPYVMLPVGQ